MKARVKTTGRIVDVELYYITPNIKTYTDGTQYYKIDELDVNVEYDDPNYWTRLEHQYAGMAMQGMLSNTSLITVLFDATKDHDELLKEVVICSHEYAHALVKKLKEGRK